MTSYWSPATDETTGIRISRASGKVIQNGEIHDGLVAMAFSNRAPYHERPKGTSRESMNKVRTGDVLFVLQGHGARINKLGGSGAHNTNKILAISLLNGQGKKEGKDQDVQHDALMNEIQFQGIAEQGNGDQPEHLAGSLFNVIVGGIIPLKNICNQEIERGDWLELWVPKPNELASGSGKHKSPQDVLGEVRAWLRPFRVDSFKTIPKSVYNCLTHPEEYRLVFKETCDAFLDSAIEMAAIITAVSEDDAAGEAFYTAMRDPTRRQELVDALFASYSDPDIRTLGAASTMDSLRYSASGKYLAAAGRLLHERTKNVAGRATTGGLPGHWYNFQLSHYGSG